MYSTSTRSWWNKLPACLCLVLLSAYYLPSAAQVEQPIRYEVPLRNSDAPFEVTPARDNGLFLHRHLMVDDHNYVEIIRLDTAFQRLWNGFLNVDKDLVPVGIRTEGEFIYLLFRHTGAGNFELFRMAQQDGTYTRHTVRNFIRFNATEFQATDEAILIGGYFNRVPLVLYYGLAAGQSKVLPGIFNEEGELTQIRTYPDGSFDVLISARNSGRQKTLWIKNYHPDGTLINNLPLVPEDRKGLLFGRSVKTINRMQIVAGVYGRHHTEYSRGIFIATIDPNGLQQLKYYNFGDLQNFFKYMKAKREHRIRNRIERRKIRGKKIKFNYRFLVHEVIEHEGQYIMLGEAFYPQYRSMSSAAYAGFFRPYRNSPGTTIRGDQIFDGYRYTHAVIIGFDQHGRILWDNSFEINDVKTFTLEQFVRFEVQGDKIVLLYLFEDQIRTKIIQDSHVLEGKTIDPIRKRFEMDMPVKETNNVSQLNYWYDDFFYAFGVQNIVNVHNPEVSPKRRVFFINKISYR